MSPPFHPSDIPVTPANPATPVTPVTTEIPLQPEAPEVVVWDEPPAPLEQQGSTGL